MQDKVTVKDFQRMKEDKEKITMLTSYTYPIAKIVDDAGIDSILVGDSLGMTILGHNNTLKVTLENSIMLTQAVSRAVNRALLIGDLPFGTYGINSFETVKNAYRLVKEGNAEAVKLEGGRERIKEIEKILNIGIPVLGHIGLTPTYVNIFGGFKVQGREEKQAQILLEDAKMLEEAGVFAIVLESIPWKLAKKITENVTIPTIGIGAGEYCDGQVLVIDDILGLNFQVKPRFIKQYANIKDIISEAVKNYYKEVKNGSFPSEEQRYD
ncbi:MAG: 3-methyl-2-oxobutanoate hydroxymethyltransferase [Candidatus Heimdallarchaeum endolithica]|uniref:3-methyl-2-oxobutanoate hydroxymethyltransferase n=1 Tax=Candidatus Heimdallarchaeum endolithica TaxID=2876572 RepID=A0A9Y1BS50_9ARCH|nr:MAG: 3-methyl-2-oxobutanoate hydroxymethyltransferase [Candidatus Heimdallarchaeum endolithica]